MRYLAKLEGDGIADRSVDGSQILFGAEGDGENRIDYSILPNVEATAWFSAGVERLVFLLSGKLTAIENGRAIVVDAGGYLFIPRGRHVTLAGSEADPARFLDIRTSVDESLTPVLFPSRRCLPEHTGRVDVQLFSAHTGHMAEGRAFDTQTLVDRKAGSERIKAFMSLVHPGSGMGLHFHPFDQLYYVLDGTLSVRLGFSHARLAQGDLVNFPQVWFTATRMMARFRRCF
jgi:quercetin dioxygenase-like cupin family protein